MLAQKLKHSLAPSGRLVHARHEVKMLKASSSKSVEEPAIPPVILSRAKGNLQQFRKNMMELQINRFWSMKEMFGKFLSDTYHRKTRESILDIFAILEVDPRHPAQPFPFCEGITDPEKVPLGKALILPGVVYHYVP
jgi:hypothetical protein